MTKKISKWPEMELINKIRKIITKSQKNVKIEISKNPKIPINDKKWQKIKKYQNDPKWSWLTKFTKLSQKVKKCKNWDFKKT